MSWDRVDGPEVIDQLTKDDPATWAKLTVAVLPRDVGPEFMGGERLLTNANAIKLLDGTALPRKPHRQWSDL